MSEVTAESLFRKDEVIKIKKEQHEISEAELEEELVKRWDHCRLSEPEKFRYYVSMLCETVLFPVYNPLPANDSPPYYPECTLRPSPSRHHDGPCTPDERRCENCWSYWCGNCGSGMANWMGGCCSDVVWRRKVFP